MRIIFALLLGLSVYNCTSKTESKGIDNVLSFYGGKAVYSSGIAATTKNELRGRFYELKLSGVAAKMKQYFTSLQLPASNCAYIFYHALSLEERNKYSFIRIKIVENQSTSTYEFTTQELAKVEQAMLLVTKSVAYMRDEDYEHFLAKGNLLAASYQEWQNWKSLFIMADKKYGRVQTFSLQGFEISQRNFKKSGSTEFIHLVGVLIRNKQNTDFTFVLVPANSTQGKYLYGLSFSKLGN